MIEIVLFVFGTIAGSYVAATVWRLRAEQIVDDQNDHNYKKLISSNHLSGLKAKDDYSRCLDCGYRLRWYDMIPIVSWLMLRGRCRQCHKTIGVTEIMAEFGTGIVFVLSYHFWPYPISWSNLLTILMFGIFISQMMILAILFIYDLRWMELPTKVLHVTIGISTIFAVLRVAYLVSQSSYDIGIVIIDYLASIAILAGLYYALDKYSRGKWVGSGDAYVGLAIALLLGNWKLAAVALFGANLIGSLIAIGGMSIKRIGRNSHLPLGPLLIVGGLIAFFWGHYLIYRFLPFLSLY